MSPNGGLTKPAVGQALPRLLVAALTTSLECNQVPFVPKVCFVRLLTFIPQTQLFAKYFHYSVTVFSTLFISYFQRPYFASIFGSIQLTYARPAYSLQFFSNPLLTHMLHKSKLIQSFLTHSSAHLFSHSKSAAHSFVHCFINPAISAHTP